MSNIILNEWAEIEASFKKEGFKEGIKYAREQLQSVLINNDYQGTMKSFIAIGLMRLDKILANKEQAEKGE